MVLFYNFCAFQNFPYYYIKRKLFSLIFKSLTGITGHSSRVPNRFLPSWPFRPSTGPSWSTCFACNWAYLPCQAPGIESLCFVWLGRKHHSGGAGERKDRSFSFSRSLPREEKGFPGDVVDGGPSSLENSPFLLSRWAWIPIRRLLPVCFTPNGRGIRSDPIYSFLYPLIALLGVCQGMGLRPSFKGSFRCKRGLSPLLGSLFSPTILETHRSGGRPQSHPPGV